MPICRREILQPCHEDPIYLRFPFVRLFQDGKSKNLMLILQVYLRDNLSACTTIGKLVVEQKIQTELVHYKQPKIEDTLQ